MFSKQLLVIVLFLPFLRCTIQKPKIVDVMFRPYKRTFEHVEDIDVSDSEENKRETFMQLRFSVFDDDIDVLLHRSLDPDLYETMVEIRGGEGQNDSEIRHFNAEYYEFNNSTTSVQGFRNRHGQFEGSVLISNGYKVYYIEPAIEYFPDDPSVVSKSIVYEGDEDINEYPDKDDTIPYESENEYDYNSTEPPTEHIEQQDHTFLLNFEFVADESMIEKKGNDSEGYIYLHAKTADLIIRRTRFGPFTLRIISKKITIYTNISDPKYPLKNKDPPEIRHTSSLLGDFKRTHKHNYSASVFLTFKKYLGSQNGIAFVGGICMVNQSFAVIKLVGPKGLIRSLSSTTRTVTHEIGHLLGSNHDELDGKECIPGFGSYIMGKSGTEGDKNLERFSQCSVKNITSNFVRAMKDERCKKYSSYLATSSKCGNAIKEAEEECDCGTIETCEMIDKCCTPRGGLGGDPECTYRRHINSECSSRDDRCCTKNCTIQVAGKECDFGHDGCIIQECDGASKECPEFKKIAPVGRKCFAQLGECLYGSCGKSLCEKNGLENCMCSGVDVCRFCCLIPGNSSCVPVKTLNAFNGENMFLPYGTKCGMKRVCAISGDCVKATETATTTTTIPSSTTAWMKWIIILGASCFVLSIGIVAFVISIRRRKRTRQVSLEPMIAQDHV